MSAAGSLGAMLSAPIGQALNQAYGWRVGVIGFAILALIMLPAAWYAGKVDKIAAAAIARQGTTARALRSAARSRTCRSSC